ncbi:hypothetical protein EG329_011121 [Mollisiaceae sp. DMI_Dod_QoI]|nr:hypothetical protein EG329_011121 [Helotiales sp. DMI_Dod_QoI]
MLITWQNRSPPPRAAAMPKKYGSKRSAAAPGASAIFGEASRSPLEDVTSALNNLSLREEEKAKEEDDDDREQANIIRPHPALLPLINAYKTDFNKSLIVQDWNDILDDGADVTKIAEASYAEVYRINTAAGSSILKVMQIKLEDLPEPFRSNTAVEVNSLISEIRIMNALTTVPGFVTFKDAHLVQGLIPRCITKAYRLHSDELKQVGKASYFPRPSAYDDDTIFLVIELGDAGYVLDECEIDTADQLWDSFIGVTIALARAEITNNFEHRDLHENNICIKYDPDNLLGYAHNPDTPLKFGFSGWDVTIIDYGLSRATLANGEVAFNDLEQELSLFHGQDKGIAGHQYDTYRRMRTHLFDGTRTMHPKPWHTPSSRALNNGHTWSDFIPYTNVLWLRYLLKMLFSKLKKNIPASDKNTMKNLETETAELRRRLDTRTKIDNGAFSSAQDILLWMSEQGWVSEEQIAGEGGDETTFLSQS